MAHSRALNQCCTTQNGTVLNTEKTFCPIAQNSLQIQPRHNVSWAGIYTVFIFTKLCCPKNTTLYTTNTNSVRTKFKEEQYHYSISLSTVHTSHDERGLLRNIIVIGQEFE